MEYFCKQVHEGAILTENGSSTVVRNEIKAKHNVFCQQKRYRFKGDLDQLYYFRYERPKVRC